MLKAIKGNKLIQITKVELENLCKSYEKVEMDLGTGDGRFVYKSALQNTQIFYIGIDPSQKQLEIYSKKAVKNKVNNALFILSSIELLPEELKSIAEVVYITLPWGSLLQHIVKPNLEILQKIADLIKYNGMLKVILGYSKKTDPSEFERLNLVEVNGDLIEKTIIPSFKEVGLANVRFEKLKKADLKDLSTSWGKKLGFGQDRPVYYVEYRKLASA